MVLRRISLPKTVVSTSVHTEHHPYLPPNHKLSKPHFDLTLVPHQTSLECSSAEKMAPPLEIPRWKRELRKPPVTGARHLAINFNSGNVVPKIDGDLKCLRSIPNCEMLSPSHSHMLETGCWSQSSCKLAISSQRKASAPVAQEDSV